MRLTQKHSIAHLPAGGQARLQAGGQATDIGPAPGYAVLNSYRLEQFDELLYQLAHPRDGVAGNGDLTIRVQDGKLRFARPVPYPYFFNAQDPHCTGHAPAAGLKVINEQIAKVIDRMLAYLAGWGSGDLHILVLNGAYHAAVPVPDINVEW